MPEFYIDFDCIGSTWMRSITVQERDGNLYNFHIRPPPYWQEICFEQLSPKEYYEERLEWSDEDGAVEQEEWMDVLCEIIDCECDTIHLDNDHKCAIMNMFRFKKCINQQHNNVDTTTTTKHV